MEMKRRSRLWGIVAIVCAVILGLVMVFLAIVMTRELPEVEGEITYQNEEKPLVLTGLTQGQAAIGSVDEVKAIYGGNNVAPIASMAKLITSSVALEKNSNLDQVIIFDDNDVAFYQKAISVNGSRLKVVAGEQMTLRQMHEALLMVSANNIADSFVYHLFGTQENYKIAAEAWLKENGLEDTKIGLDASGLDPGTVSTPADMIKIGQIVLRNPVISQIVSMEKATFPLEGEVENTNELLKEGYFGIKTGNTNEAGSCLLFATKYENETIIGVLMGQQLKKVFDTAREIVVQTQNNFALTTIPAGTVVGKYDFPWGGEGVITTTEEISAVTWGDAEVEIKVNPYRQQSFVTNVGTLSLSDKTTNLEVKTTTSNADIFWRLTNINHLKW